MAKLYIFDRARTIYYFSIRVTYDYQFFSLFPFKTSPVNSINENINYIRSGVNPRKGALSHHYAQRYPYNLDVVVLTFWRARTVVSVHIVKREYSRRDFHRGWPEFPTTLTSDNPISVGNNIVETWFVILFFFSTLFNDSVTKKINGVNRCKIKINKKNRTKVFGDPKVFRFCVPKI